ncbi:FAD-dependent monooxygenase [Streptomyces sp. NPDC056401]|uniref:FAD-dependent monooxygenase n=1 Tax=Streptomyces sp. NPDC056401 TaxID=3345809 RepID=UPI0035D9BE65
MGAGQTAVVIVGAGPCGLAAAGELVKRNIPVRILDAAPGPAGGSRAILLWPPTQDVLRDLGVLDEAEAMAFRPRALHYPGDRSRLARVELRPSESVLLLPQGVTEALLEKALHRLGGEVERNVHVRDVEQDADGVTISAEEAGRPLRIRATWLVAADGVHSTVRDRLGIAFTGTRLPTRFLLAEGPLHGADPSADICYHLSSRGVLLIAPLPGGEVRLAGDVQPGVEVTPALVQDLLDARGPGGLQIGKLSTLTTFTSAERLADQLRSGRCFLVGDAAHTHSPFGGQGLNLGLQDVRNLAWKLAGVIDGRLDPAVLDTYDPERRAAAQYVTRLTGTLVRIALARPPWTPLRNALVRGAESVGALRTWYAPMLAGRRIRYPALPLGCPVGRRSAGLPAPPWAVMDPDPSRYRLLTTGEAPGAAMAACAAQMAARWPHLVTHRHIRGRTRPFVLVRPDGYVAVQGRARDLGGVDLLLREVGGHA